MDERLRFRQWSPPTIRGGIATPGLIKANPLLEGKPKVTAPSPSADKPAPKVGAVGAALPTKPATMTTEPTAAKSPAPSSKEPSASSTSTKRQGPNVTSDSHMHAAWKASAKYSTQQQHPEGLKHAQDRIKALEAKGVTSTPQHHADWVKHYEMNPHLYEEGQGLAAEHRAGLHKEVAAVSRSRLLSGKPSDQKGNVMIEQEQEAAPAGPRIPKEGPGKDQRLPPREGFTPGKPSVPKTPPEAPEAPDQPKPEESPKQGKPRLGVNMLGAYHYGFALGGATASLYGAPAIATLSAGRAVSGVHGLLNRRTSSPHEAARAQREAQLQRHTAERRSGGELGGVVTQPSPLARSLGTPPVRSGIRRFGNV